MFPLMAHPGLMSSRVPVPLGLCRFDDTPHVRFLSLSQLNISRPPVLFQPAGLRRARDGNESLRRDPRKRDLSQRAALAGSELLDLFHDGLILVEVLALELWCCKTC